MTKTLVSVTMKAQQEVSNLINGKRYLITEVSGPKEAQIAKAIEILPEDSEEEAEVVEITTEASIAYLLDKQAPAVNPSGFTIKNGVLNGPDGVVQMGTMVATSILGYVPGKVVLTASSAAEVEDNIIYTYDVEKDRFYMLRNISAYQIAEIQQEEESLLILLNEFVNKTIVKDEKEISISSFCNSFVIRIDNEGIREEILQYPVTSAEVKGDTLFVKGNDLDQLKDEAPFVDDVYEVANDGILYMSLDNLYLYDQNKIVKTAEEAEITISRLYGPVYNTGKRVFIDRATPVAAINNEIAKSLLNYPNLVNIYDKDGVKTYSFASDDYQIAKVIVKKTRDRGDIVSFVS